MKIKEQILELLNTHKSYVDNHNDAIFTDSFESLTEGLVKLFDTTIVSKIQEEIKEMKSLKEQLALTEYALNKHQRVLDDTPKCEIHGECIPHSIEWNEKMRKQFKLIQ